MEFITNLVRKYIDSNIKKVTKTKKRDACFIDFKTCKSVVILFDATKINEKHLKNIIEYINKDKKVTAWGYSPKDEMERDSVSVHYLHKKDISMLGKPNTIIEKNFLSEEADILIDLTLNEIMPLKYLLGISQVHCKCGMQKSEFNKMYDLEINLSKNINEKELFSQILNTLNMIKVE